MSFFISKCLSSGFIFLGLLILAPTLAQAQAFYADLHRESYGQVDFGARLENTEKILGEKMLIEGEELDGCYFGTFSKYPDVSFMVTEGRIIRASVFIPDIMTADGVTVGKTEKEVRALISPVKKQKDPYDTFELISVEEYQPYGFLFQLEEGKVSEIRAGFKDAIQLAEGCL